MKSRLRLSDEQFEAIDVNTRRSMIEQLMFIDTPKYQYCIGANGKWWTMVRYEGYPRFYGKQNVFVDTTRGRKKGMVYIMNKYSIPGRPSQYYIDTLEEGYADNGLDLAYLDESLYDNYKECRFQL